MEIFEERVCSECKLPSLVHFYLVDTSCLPSSLCRLFWNLLIWCELGLIAIRDVLLF